MARSFGGLSHMLHVEDGDPHASRSAAASPVVPLKFRIGTRRVAQRLVCMCWLLSSQRGDVVLDQGQIGKFPGLLKPTLEGSTLGPRSQILEAWHRFLHEPYAAIAIAVADEDFRCT